MKIYNKLVRDKIPEIIENSGKTFDIHYAKKEDLIALLEAKLLEEAKEFSEDKNLEELADLMEVILGLTSTLGFSEEELIKKRNEKKAERGGFEKGIVLEKVYE
ncbi:nucleoside triphosphate pyrophosphohydrolase [Clostridium felsineum]|uniref:nucleoside triphosphate pyrophosphohydrolase n=1 Tax=Clostridium felsineum TaxID=36839 RepID=UPI00214D73C3|nr:nucleoside triphosphate pyrophosphohydrolase [Clostridium felsineum]MCR3758434.1 nucleoside triphosphate pyrophosphohydrolase [Clostridium felsineum]